MLGGFQYFNLESNKGHQQNCNFLASVFYSMKNKFQKRKKNDSKAYTNNGAANNGAATMWSGHMLEICGHI